MIKESGQMLVLAIIVVAFVLINTLVIISGATLYSSNSNYSLQSTQATDLAEAGVNKALASLNKTGGSYNGETETFLGSGSYSVAVTNKDAAIKVIQATGYIPNKTNPKTKRTISIQASTGAGLSFNYAVQAGEGGFTIAGGSIVNGTVYSNNNITLSGGGKITGSAYAAGGTQASPDQQTDCSGVNCTDLIFGKTVGASTQLDIAQSFKPSSTMVINKVQLKLKKFGNPSNLPVRILGDNGGSPNKGNVLATGTLGANLVTTSYGFIEVALIPTPVLTADTTYWIMIDTASDANNYWAWSEDLAQSYMRGTAKWSVDWNAKKPIWNNIQGDLGFKTYMGGVVTKIEGIGSSNIGGSAYANTLTGDNSSALQIANDAYYQVQSGITVHGSPCTGNPRCHPGSSDPVPKSLPISEANITEWKDMANGTPHVGDLVIQWPCTTNLEKKKYIGNVTVQGGCTVYADSPVWITGNLIVQGGSTVRLKSSYGTQSGVVVVDGTIALAGGSKFLGSGTDGSYITALSTYNSHVAPAITVNGGNHTSIVYAGDGIINLAGGVNIRQVTAYKITMDGGAILSYEDGVANPDFPSGPSGSFSLIKGTYQLK